MGRFSVSYLMLSVIYAVSDLGIIIFAVVFAWLCERKSIPVIINQFIKLVGVYSLEIYTLQGLILRFFANYIDNKLLYVGCVLVSLAVLAIPYQHLNRFLKNRVVGKNVKD